MKATLLQPHHLPGLGTMQAGIELEGLVEGNNLEVWLWSKIYLFPLEKLRLHPLPVTVVMQGKRRTRRKQSAQQRRPAAMKPCVAPPVRRSVSSFMRFFK